MIVLPLKKKRKYFVLSMFTCWLLYKTTMQPYRQRNTDCVQCITKAHMIYLTSRCLNRVGNKTSSH